MGVLVNADGDQQAVNIWGLLLSFFFFFSFLFTARCSGAAVKGCKEPLQDPR